MNTRALAPFVISALALHALAGAGVAVAQSSSPAEVACHATLASGAADVLRAQGRLGLGCLRRAALGHDDGALSECPYGDFRSNIERVIERAAEAAADDCSAGRPALGLRSASVAADQARLAGAQAMADLFGATLEAAPVDCGSDRDGCRCQSVLLQRASERLEYEFESIGQCLTATLEAGAIGDT